MQVQDASKKATTITQDYHVAVAAPGAFIICSTYLPAGTKGKTYSFQIVAQGGTAPYLWGISAGQLPKGLVLSATGVLTGTPTAKGDFTFTVVADDSVSSTPAFSQNYTLHIK
jgi:hypothetical protein